ncbi:hypothetical protein FQN54_006033 [Arachnomyces sp. PD_36]|nr:hypothetical protein FQN54_006033 [Arachnomyces sp. PD_36]
MATKDPSEQLLSPPKLAKLKPAVVKVAVEAWEGYNIAGERARQVQRVLDVRQGELCWVAGTIYMDMPLKPNILDDISRDHWTAAPPPHERYIDPSTADSTRTMLEDESGRLRLIGSKLRSSLLVTGAIIAVLGTENADGDFEVIDIKVPDLPDQPQRWERDETNKGSQDEKPSKKIALLSGLGITGSSGDSVELSLLTDYLLGFSGDSAAGIDDNGSLPSPVQISRLVIAGNSLGDGTATDQDAFGGSEDAVTKKRKPPAKKYGYDASSYNASPITRLDSFLSEILPSIPVTLMPGEHDPANYSLPQQQIHRAMFQRSRAYCSEARPGIDETETEPGWFDNVTNPWEGDVEGWRLWGCAGQNVDDVLRYIDPTVNEDDDEMSKETSDRESRLQIMEMMLRWRCAAPTAPDTLWCYPYQHDDPFVLQASPHIFFVGNQPSFQTAIIEGSTHSSPDEDDDMSNDGDKGIRVRVISLPKFSQTGELVLVDAETLEVEVVKFSAFGEEGIKNEQPS